MFHIVIKCLKGHKSVKSLLGKASKIGIFPKQGGGSRIPKLYVKFWWPMFLALKTRLFWPKVTFLFLNVPIAHIFFGDNDFDSLFDIYILMMF